MKTTNSTTMGLTRMSGKEGKPGQRPHSVASNHGQHCLRIPVCLYTVLRVYTVNAFIVQEEIFYDI